ncbi:hypothetical protein DL771_003904 [Monosporascus sp. 5C6A]|nr:hypothetical protein DL771_003904 [Monosporascus sp. 5C6A]
MHDLFLTLSAWEPQGDLKLDISIHSPSDSQHWFKYLTFGPDTLPHSQVTFSQRDDPEHGWNAGTPSSAPTDLALGKVFAEILSESPVRVFFNKEQESKWWQTLPEVPAITVLNAQEDPDRINDMLEAAASTALKMPKLKTLEIWNGRVGSAALLRYQFEGSGCAVLSWKATWKFTLQPRVIKAWKAVAHAPDSDNYFLVQGFLDETISVNSHADAINYLELFKVLRPISLQQILAAHEMRREGVPQELGLARPQPTAMHQKPSFSGKYWAKALRYYWGVKGQYHSVPRRAEFMAHDFIPWLRERRIVDSDLEDFLLHPRNPFPARRRN